MLSALWCLPLAVAAGAVVPLWRGARCLEQEAAALQVSVAELGRVRPMVERLKADVAAVDATGRGFADFGHR